jgi:hypothetical protein
MITQNASTLLRASLQIYSIINVLRSKSRDPLLQDKSIQLSLLIYDNSVDEILSPATSTTGDFCKDTIVQIEIFNRGMQEKKKDI